MTPLQEGPTLSHVHYTYSQISVICRFGPNNLMASWGYNGDAFVGFRRGGILQAVGLVTGMVEGLLEN
jgi:hypothetical protein